MALAVLAVLLVTTACEPVDPTVKETPVRILHEVEGVGRPVQRDDMISINYDLRLPSGELLLSGNQFRFQVGNMAVIEGIDDAVRGMRVGGSRKVEIPPHKHWGREGYGDGAVPHDTTLTATIYLLAIE